MKPSQKQKKKRRPSAPGAARRSHGRELRWHRDPPPFALGRLELLGRLEHLLRLAAEGAGDTTDQSLPDRLPSAPRPTVLKFDWGPLLFGE